MRWLLITLVVSFLVEMLGRRNHYPNSELGQIRSILGQLYFSIPTPRVIAVMAGQVVVYLPQVSI